MAQYQYRAAREVARAALSRRHSKKRLCYRRPAGGASKCAVSWSQFCSHRPWRRRGMTVYRPIRAPPKRAHGAGCRKLWRRTSGNVPSEGKGGKGPGTVRRSGQSSLLVDETGSVGPVGLLLRVGRTGLDRAPLRLGAKGNTRPAARRHWTNKPPTHFGNKPKSKRKPMERQS